MKKKKGRGKPLRINTWKKSDRPIKEVMDPSWSSRMPAYVWTPLCLVPELRIPPGGSRRRNKIECVNGGVYNADDKKKTGQLPEIDTRN